MCSRAQLSAVSHPAGDQGFSFTELPPQGTSAQMAFVASLSCSVARLGISCSLFSPLSVLADGREISVNQK